MTDQPGQARHTTTSVAEVQPGLIGKAEFGLPENGTKTGENIRPPCCGNGRGKRRKCVSEETFSG